MYNIDTNGFFLQHLLLYIYGLYFKHQGTKQVTWYDEYNWYIFYIDVTISTGSHSPQDTRSRSSDYRGVKVLSPPHLPRIGPTPALNYWNNNSRPDTARVIYMVQIVKNYGQRLITSLFDFIVFIKLFSLIWSPSNPKKGRDM